MTLVVTGSYAAALTLFFVLLSVRVILYRRHKGINLGERGDRQLLRRIRAQGNFSEYAPLGIVLLAIAETQDEAAVWLHIVGASLLVGRLAHGINFSFVLNSAFLRVGGMGLTLNALLLGAGLALPL